MSATIPQHALGYFRRPLARFFEWAEDDERITEFMRNPDGQFVVDIAGELVPIEDHDIDDNTVLSLGSNAAVATDVAWNDEQPVLSVMLEGGWRCTFVRPPVTRRPIMSLRRLLRRSIPLADYVSDGIMTAEQRQLLERLVAEKKTIIVSGEVGSGKSTLLRALAELIPHTERIVTIEDPVEISLTATDGVSPRPNWVALEAVPGVVDMAALLRTSLRLRGDRLIVGEVRGSDALEMLRACNVGMVGTMGTIHSHGHEEALERLYTLATETQPHFKWGSVVSAIDVVVQITGRGKERRISEIWENEHATHRLAGSAGAAGRDSADHTGAGAVDQPHDQEPRGSVLRA